ncbi:MAG: hypothetical protein H0S80_05830 [Desulfovibrionaceae bacterium]|nr:hypothetical protein [Desulfovibrionaceae bacterium]
MKRMLLAVMLTVCMCGWANAAMTYYHFAGNVTETDLGTGLFVGQELKYVIGFDYSIDGIYVVDGVTYALPDEALKTSFYAEAYTDLVFNGTVDFVHRQGVDERSAFSTNSMGEFITTVHGHDEILDADYSYRLTTRLQGSGEEAFVRNWALHEKLEALLWSSSAGCGKGEVELIGISDTYSTSTPLPGAVWMLGAGLAGLAGIRRGRRP